jgi:ribosomal protein S6
MRSWNSAYFCFGAKSEVNINEMTRRYNLNSLIARSLTVHGTECESALSKVSLEANELWLAGTYVGTVREYGPV